MLNTCFNPLDRGNLNQISASDGDVELMRDGVSIP